SVLDRRGRLSQSDRWLGAVRGAHTASSRALLADCTASQSRHAASALTAAAGPPGGTILASRRRFGCILQPRRHTLSLWGVVASVARGAAERRCARETAAGRTTRPETGIQKQESMEHVGEPHEAEYALRRSEERFLA